jgi:hypothetical protein
MYDLLGASIPVAASRELAMSALPDAPVVADERRRGRRRLRRGSGRLRLRTALVLRRFAEHREAA